ncbi:MAG: efflux RND transporter permease subunit [Gemmatimonadetes bacterium]|nr:efflux RND transporter permease subunit [Gemmatimonadota bacterium]
MTPEPTSRERRSGGGGESGGGLSGWAIRRPIGTLMLTSILLVLGAVFAGRIPVDLLPRIVYPQIRVNVTNPGVEPVVLEETIAKPLEAALATTENLTRIETDIDEGRVGISLHFNYGTNVDFALQDAAKNVERVRARLPEEADPPNVWKFDPSQIPIYQLAFSSAERGQIALREWVDQRLRPQLLSIPGVASIDLSGGLVREIQVVLDQERLNRFGLTVSQVISALRAANQDLAAGRVTSDQQELVGKTAGRFGSVDDIRNVLLTSGAGVRIPLADIAAVRDTNAEQRTWGRLDGVPAVRLSVRKQPEANTVQVVDQVSARLATLERSNYIPADIRYRITDDQSVFIRDALAAVRNAAVIGAFLAMLVVIVFLRSFRKTLIIGLSIPLAVLATVIMMGMADLTLNIMSLGGLALGTGLLLDNSIVVLENVFRRREHEGLDGEQAAHAGASEVQGALIASTTTNLAAVAPFLLMTGLTALIFRELILTISFAIFASLPLALSLVPMLSAKLGKVRFASGLERFRPLVAVERGMERLTRGYRRTVTGAVRFRVAVLAGALLLFVAATVLLRRLENVFLPQVDDGGVGVNIRLPPGAPPQQTNAIARELEVMVRDMPHVESVYTTAGGSWMGNAAGRGSLDVRLVPASQRPMSADRWVREMQQRIQQRGFAGARVFVRPPRIRGLRTSASGEDVAISIHGDELHVLEAIGLDIQRRLQGLPGLANVQMQTEEASPQLSIVLDRERARAQGLDVATVGQTVRTAVDGTVATRYAEGSFEYDVRVMMPRERFRSPEALGSVALFPGGSQRAGGGPIYLRDVADVRRTIGPAAIQRENQSRRLRVTGDVISEVAPLTVVNDSVRQRLQAVTLPDGYGTVIGGEQEAIAEGNRQMLLVIVLAVFLVLVVLAVQYESLLDPLVILLAVPLSLVGVVTTLAATDTPLSAPVYLGMILLAGIVVNNAILLVAFAEDFRRRAGAPTDAAVIEAGVVRLRPIMMTTLTSLMGLSPLALGLGGGSELMRPLAIAVVGGIVFSALLTLFVVPCAFVVVHGVGDRVKSWVLGERLQPKEGEDLTDLEVA